MSWLANVVLVKKNRSRMEKCVEYIDLNKHCLKDSYLLPDIDKLVDGSSDYQYLSFMNAYSRYNQIRLHSNDQEKTTFMIEKANYCYKVMSFGLKNDDTTYQRMMNKVFEKQIGQNLEVYVDDMIVKSNNNNNNVLSH